MTATTTGVGNDDQAPGAPIGRPGTDPCTDRRCAHADHVRPADRRGTILFGRRVPAFVPPVAVAAIAAVGCLVARMFDPAGASTLPGCPFYAVTGLDCPGCGMSRGVHALVSGDVATALDHNVLLALAVPAAVAAWVAWLGRSVGLPIPHVRPSTRAVLVTCALLGVFAVVRNLPIDALYVLDARA